MRRVTLEQHILEHVEAGSSVSSDELASYAALDKRGYKHDTVNHSKDEWARGDTHVNTAEGFWSRLKLSIRGTHVHVSAKHLPKYLAEFEFRFNLRKSPHLMFDRLLASF